jgi:predicted aldo/keto reductase-like oxidoreductase
MKTDYVDFYQLHGPSDPSVFTDEIKQWAEKAKRQKKIRLFGFSTHSNMPQCLTAAAKLGWIDAIMTSYNFRLMLVDDMKKAIDACQKTGIGLVAMKTLGLRVRPGEEFTEEDKKVYKHFMDKGYTEVQARIKAILQDGRIASACVGVKSVTELEENINAVVDKQQLTKQDHQVLADYARKTKTDYCAGCAHICSCACPDMPYIAEVMRYMMYHNSYGEQILAKENFAMLPSAAKAKLLTADYSLAAKLCPNHLPIAKIMSQAARKLA